MPYYARKHQLQNSLVYHAYNRSNGRVKIFHCDADYRHFTKLLIGYSSEFNLKVYHWVIMPNHYHLLLELDEPTLISKFMAGLHRTYTCYYHRTYGTAGFLWQGRFKLQPVQKDRNLIACARYIERNPIRANIVSQAQEYLYSSAQYYCLGKDDGFTCECPSFVEFGSDAIKRKLSYAAFLQDFNAEEEKTFANMNFPQGGIEFMRRLFVENGRYIPRRRGRPKQRIVS